MLSYRVLIFLVVLTLLTATAVALAHPAPSAPNTTFTVTTTEDSDDGLCDNHCSLREAITAANTTLAADTITFTPSLTGNITLSGSQLPTITNTLTIDASPVPGRLVIVADNSRIFQVASGASVTITHLTLTTGLSPNGGAIYNEGRLTLQHTTLYNNRAIFGGGIYNTATLFLINTTLSQNNADQAGGAIFNTGTLTATNNTLAGNLVLSLDDGIGDGLVNDTSGTLYWYNNVVASNTSHDDCHSLGAIAANVNNFVGDGSCNPLLQGNPQLGPLPINGPPYTYYPLPGSPLLDAGANATCPPTDQMDVTRPQDSNGDGTAVCEIGAVEIPTIQTGPHYVVNATESLYGFCTVTNCILPVAITAANLTPAPDTITFALPADSTIHAGFTHFITNTLTIDGSTADRLTLTDGWYVLTSGATVTLTHLTIGDSGYFSVIINQGTLALLNSTISNRNPYSVGAPILNEGQLFISNSTISHNLNQGEVAAIRNEGVLTMTNTTLSDNLALFSENTTALYNSGTLYWYNTLIADTFNTVVTDCVNVGVIAATVNNLVEDGTCNATFSGDPLLGSLQYNGGRTLNQLLLPGSPAIDAGDPTTCLPADQRDYPRPQDGDNDGTAVCDIGSFEAYWPFTFYLPFIDYAQQLSGR